MVAQYNARQQKSSASEYGIMKMRPIPNAWKLLRNFPGFFPEQSTALVRIHRSTESEDIWILCPLQKMEKGCNI